MTAEWKIEMKRLINDAVLIGISEGHIDSVRAALEFTGITYTASDKPISLRNRFNPDFSAVECREMAKDVWINGTHEQKSSILGHISALNQASIVDAIVSEYFSAQK